MNATFHAVLGISEGLLLNPRGMILNPNYAVRIPCLGRLGWFGRGRVKKSRFERSMLVSAV